MAEYLARVSWDTVVDFRERLRQRGTAKAPPRLPLTNQYGSGQKALNKLVFGDGLWLFTAPVYGSGTRRRTLPPSVLGRIEITHQGCGIRGETWPASGAPDDTPFEFGEIHDLSRYRYWRGGIPGDPLPIHNAFSIFKSLEFEGRVKKVDPKCPKCNETDVPGRGPFGHFMEHFQAIRRLTASSASSLAELLVRVVSRRTLFLSHRHEEAGQVVAEVARILSRRVLCWWDIEALPQSRHYADPILQDILSDGIRQAGWFVSFLTPSYGKTPWTDEEWERAQEVPEKLGVAGPRILPVLLGGMPREGKRLETPIDAGWSPKKIAAEILERLEIADQSSPDAAFWESIK